MPHQKSAESSEDNFEILRKSISTGYMTVPRAKLILMVSATVRCPDQSELEVNITISDLPVKPEEVDSKILATAKQIYRPG